MQLRIVALGAVVTVAGWAQIPSEAYRPQGGGLDSVAQSVGFDLQKLRVEKWKTDSATKDQQLHNVQSLQRSLSGTLPEQAAAVQNSSDVAAMFKLYRTLSATCDVLRDVAESAGAFGPRSDYEQLAADLNQLTQARSRLAEQIDAAAQQQTAQINSLRNAAAQQQVAAAPTPSKKIIVDNDAPPKKTVRKRKTPAKTPPAADGTSQSTSENAPKNQ